MALYLLKGAVNRRLLSHREASRSTRSKNTVMAYDIALSDRIREGLVHLDGQVEEKRMFGGICFMLNGKMCVGVLKDEMMCRIGPDEYEQALGQPGCREMRFTGRPMKGYVFVSSDAAATKKELQKWLDLCIAYNADARQSPRKKKRSYLL